MPSERIKGQDVALSVVVDGQIQQSLAEIRSFEATMKFDKKQEGYLGEKSDRYDEIFNGIDARIVLHFEDDGVFEFLSVLRDRARRKTPGVTINVQATLNFPNGDRPIVVIPDAFFGNVPMNFASRHDYGEISLDMSSSDITFIT